MARNSSRPSVSSWSSFSSPFLVEEVRERLAGDEVHQDPAVVAGPHVYEVADLVVAGDVVGGGVPAGGAADRRDAQARQDDALECERGALALPAPPRFAGEDERGGAVPMELQGAEVDVVPFGHGGVRAFRAVEPADRLPHRVHAHQGPAHVVAVVPVGVAAGAVALGMPQ